MNNLTDLTKDVESVTRSLREYNESADAMAERRDWKELERLVREYGVSNVVGIMADICENLAEDPDDPEAVDDYKLAHQVLEVAANGVDLTYGQNPVRSGITRRNAIKDLKEDVARL